jgi:HPt (histidine-containing phosphotransfer) domain-containing protein
MIIFFWFILFLIVFIIIFYGLLKDLNTLILKKYSIYFCDLSLKEVYESGEEYELELLKELGDELKNKNKIFENIFGDFFNDEKKHKEAIQKGAKMADYSTLRQLKERFEQQLIQLKKSKNGNNSKQISYVEDWILKLNREMKK